MRLNLLTATLLVGAAFVAQPAHAEIEYPYCTVPGFGASQDCSFTTLTQCRAATQGVGTECVSNPRFKGPVSTPPQPRRSGTKS